MAATQRFDAALTQEETPDDPRIPTLIWWAARFAELGFTPSYGPGDHGNLSCRTPGGLIVTARQTQKAALTPEQFVEVLNGQDALQPGVILQCRGHRLPSTDALMHLRLYALRPDVGAILHGHDQAALARAQVLHLPVTTVSAATPSMALIDDVCAMAAKGASYLLMRDHGFLALGRTADEAGELVRSINGRARAV